MLTRMCLFEFALQGQEMGLGVQSDGAVQWVRCMKWLQVNENASEEFCCFQRWNGALDVESNAVQWVFKLNF